MKYADNTTNFQQNPTAIKRFTMYRKYIEKKTKDKNKYKTVIQTFCIFKPANALILSSGLTLKS